MSKFQQGERWVNSLGRDIVIVGVDTVPTTVAGVHVDVVAYRFADGDHVHLRRADLIQGWRKV